MKHAFPRKADVVAFGLVSVVLATLAVRSPNPDVLLALLSMPLFVACALAGMHRSGRLSPVRQETPHPTPARTDRRP
jgi:hypothetical protein